MAKADTHDRVLDSLVAFAAHMKGRPLSAVQKEALVQRVIDSLGCGILASVAPDVTRITDSILRLGGAPQCGILGREKSSLEHAGYLNGLMIRYLDMNDIYINRNGSHPSDLISAALAAGELAGKSGHDVLQALATGMHVMMDFCDAADAYVRGWDHANYSGIASAIVAGMLLDLTSAEMAHAISLTVVSGNMLVGRSGRLSTWKGLAGPASVRNGLFSAVLAQASATGPEPIFEGDSGFIRRVSGPFELELDPTRDRTGDTYLKPYAAAYHVQAPIETCLQLRAQMVDELGDEDVTRAIDSIRIDVYKKALATTADTADKWRPDTRETADHSLPFLAALALSWGKFEPDSIDNALGDGEILGLAQRVRVNVDPSFESLYPRLLPVRIVVSARGREYVAEASAPSGHSTRPMPASAVYEKFQSNSEKVLGPERSRAWVERLRRLPDLSRIDGLLNPTASTS